MPRKNHKDTKIHTKAKHPNYESHKKPNLKLILENEVGDSVEKRISPILDDDLEDALKPIKEEIANTESSNIEIPKKNFITKNFNILIFITILLFLALGSTMIYLLDRGKSPSQTQAADQIKPKISESQIEAINKLAITPASPGLEKFVFVLNKGSALPISQIDLDKRGGFIAGTEATLASDLDELGQRMALVQSVALYEDNSAQKLNLKDYKQEDFQKLECSDVADECALFYKPSKNRERPIDAYRIYFRKKNFVFYFEFAKNDKNPEFDVSWLKKVSNELASKVE